MEQVLVQCRGHLQQKKKIVSNKGKLGFFVHLTTLYIMMQGTVVAQWLRYCATHQKVAGLIPDGVIGTVH
jgi:hypothetical protein